MGAGSLEGVVRLAKAFPELPTQRLISMEKASGANKKAKPNKAPSTVHGPSRRQVLVNLVPAPSVLDDTYSVLVRIRTKLTQHHSALVAQSVSLAYGGFSISTDCVASDTEIGAIRDGVREAYPAATRVEAALPTSTSYLKLVDVPRRIGESDVTPEMVVARIAGAGLSDLVVLVTPPRVIRDSRQSDTATVYLNIADSTTGSRARALLSRSVQIGRFVCPFRAARTNPGAALCQRCWRWGHPMSQCRAPQIRCPICSGPHRAEHHRTLGGCCKGNAKAVPPIPPTAPDAPCPHPPRCPNCRKDHSADSRKCAFWRHRFDQEWIKARYAEVRTNRGTRHPLSNHPAAGGGRT
jgi:hypothetical protein